MSADDLPVNYTSVYIYDTSSSWKHGEEFGHSRKDQTMDDKTKLSHKTTFK